MNQDNTLLDKKSLSILLSLLREQFFAPRYEYRIAYYGKWKEFLSEKEGFIVQGYLENIQVSKYGEENEVYIDKEEDNFKIETNDLADLLYCMGKKGFKLINVIDTNKLKYSMLRNLSMPEKQSYMRELSKKPLSDEEYRKKINDMPIIISNLFVFEKKSFPDYQNKALDEIISKLST